MSEAATAQGTPTGNGATTVVEKPSSAPAQQQGSDWTQGLSEDLRGYIQTKGFKDPAMVVDGYRNLEKLRGVPAERLLTLPEKYDDVEGWKGVYKRLGHPEKPEGYQIEVPEGGNSEFAKAAATMFHESGITVNQGKQLVQKWNDFMAKSQKERELAHQTRITEQDNALKKEWGSAFEDNIAFAKKAAAKFGVKPEFVDALEKSMGLGEVMKFFHNVGTKLGEADHVAGSSKGQPSTPEAAKNRLSQLMNDTEFIRKIQAGDRFALQEWNEVNQMASPGTIAVEGVSRRQF